MHKGINEKYLASYQRRLQTPGDTPNRPSVDPKIPRQPQHRQHQGQCTGKRQQSLREQQLRNQRSQVIRGRWKLENLVKRIEISCLGIKIFSRLIRNIFIIFFVDICNINIELQC